MALPLLAIIPMLIGILLGLGLFPLFASPFGPGLWKAAPLFSRIFHTVAQVIRKQGVLVKRAANHYELGIYDDGDVYLSDGWHSDMIDTEKTRWALFGKRPLGVTWELGTDLHRQVSDLDSHHTIDMGAVHRYLRGANEADAISRTEQAAAAEYGGGDDGISTILMAVLIGAMAVMGSLTTYVML